MTASDENSALMEISKSATNFTIFPSSTDPDTCCKQKKTVLSIFIVTVNKAINHNRTAYFNFNEIRMLIV